MNTNGSDVALGFLYILIGIVLYFIPTYVAHGKRNFGAILALNLLTGWTFVGWIGALIWAMVEKPEVRNAQAN